MGVFRRGSSRHWRYQRQAARVLARLPQLAGEAQRLVYLRSINPYVFEELLLTVFARRGYRMVRNLRYSGDGGIDGQVWLDGERYLIQAKRYARAITPAHVSALNVLTRQYGCRGLFVHTGRTGPKSQALLRDFPAITLLSGARLLALLDSERPWSLNDGATLCPSSSGSARITTTSTRTAHQGDATVKGGLHE
ncbi:restriction endonuclease [Chania multitudinisentens]|uniref:restriction endonuclease n=1 Tax=Chania multitudinisentens TaxID=1639108 RepID=UPI001F3E66AA|nr:restriction endonuclease [Chania multitudinisentens]